MNGPPNGRRAPHGDPADAVARVLVAKRDVLLRAHRGRLAYEDLEDCLSQAALELVNRARADGLDGDRHIANALEQKFASRIIDRQRASGGRSAMIAATRDAVRLDETEDDTSVAVAAVGGEPADAATSREELARLREVAAELSDDQRLVLACQVSLGMDSAEFCDRFGWSPEKFRKVAQRARARLRKLVSDYEVGERCRGLESDVLAYAAHATSAERAVAVRRHIANCRGCAALVRDLRLASQRVGGLLPIPVFAEVGLLAKLGAFIHAKASAAWHTLATPAVDAPATAPTSGTAAAGALAGITKAGIATLCVAGVAGGGHWIVPKVALKGSERARTVAYPVPRPTPLIARTQASTRPSTGRPVVAQTRRASFRRPTRTKRAKASPAMRRTKQTGHARAVVGGAVPTGSASSSASPMAPQPAAARAPTPAPAFRKAATPAPAEFGME